MRVTRVGLKIFVDEVKAMEADLPNLYTACEKWQKYQEQKEKYGWVDNDELSFIRSQLERRMDKFRDQLSKVYDEMNDRGLVEAINGE